MSFVSQYIADFKKEWMQTGQELGIADRKQRARERRRRNADDPVKTLTADIEDNKKLLQELADQYEELQAERDKLASELAENKELLAGLAEQAETLQAERDQLAEVLRVPGVRKLLLRTYHSDPKAAKTSAAERATLDDITAKINAAYDLIEKIDKEAKTASETEAKDEAESEE
jgi:chromosome segregation ATPase